MFNPYSGVKTSILILDKSLAKKADRIAFFKVENDGFDLGAQRRPIDKNDLSQVQSEIGEYLRRLRAGESVDDFEPTQGLIVEKGKLAANGEYNLSGERYRETRTRNHEFPMVLIGDTGLFRVESGGTPKSSVEEYWNGGVPWATLVDLPSTDFITEIRSTQRTISERGLNKSSARLIPEGSVLVSTRATIGRIAINRIPLATNQGFKNIVIEDMDRVTPEYVALALIKLVPTMDAWASGGTFKEISKSKFCELQIPLPAVEVQKEIVAEIEGYQKVIDGARAVVDNYRPHIPVDPNWPVVAIGDVCVINPNTVNPQDLYPDSYFNYIDISCVENGTGLFLGANRIASAEAPSRARRAVERDDVLVSTVRPNLRAFAILTEIPHRAVASTGFAVIQPKDDSLLSQFLIHMIRNEMSVAQMVRMMDKGSYPSINQANVESIRISLPPLVVQKELVAEIEAEQELMEANRELIERFEKKISAAIGRVWGEAEPDTAEA